MSREGHLDVSAIIVTYNSSNVISGCLESLARSLTAFNAETILIDNASHDTTIETVRSVAAVLSEHQVGFRLVQNDRNLGFTKAANQGLQLASGRYVLLMNPDVTLTDHTVSRLVKRLEEAPHVGIVAPQLRYPNGNIQPSCRRFPRCLDLVFEFLGLSRLFKKSKIFNRWRMGDFDHDSAKEVDQPQGAFLLARGEVINEVGPLDERFEMFFSDVDWCRRFWNKGWHIEFRPDVFVFHQKGSSVYANRTKMIISSHRAFIQYFEKYSKRRRLSHVLLSTLFLTTAWPRVLWVRISGSLQIRRTNPRPARAVQGICIKRT